MKKYNFLPILYILIYWIICIIIPSFFLRILMRGNYSLDGWSGYLLLFILFVSPFIFILPYKISRLKTIRGKIPYILFGLVIPYIIIYLYVCIYISIFTGTGNIGF